MAKGKAVWMKHPGTGKRYAVLGGAVLGDHQGIDRYDLDRSRAEMTRVAHRAVDAIIAGTPVPGPRSSGEAHELARQVRRIIASDPALEKRYDAGMRRAYHIGE